MDFDVSETTGRGVTTPIVNLRLVSPESGPTPDSLAFKLRSIGIRVLRSPVTGEKRVQVPYVPLCSSQHSRASAYGHMVAACGQGSSCSLASNTATGVGLGDTLALQAGSVGFNTLTLHFGVLLYSAD